MEIHDDKAPHGGGASRRGEKGKGKGKGKRAGGRKPGGRGGGGAPSSNGAVPIDWEALARSTAHPLRVAILERMSLEGGRTLSPSELCRELEVPLSNTNYHVTELAKAGLIELTGTRQVRGATEHFYRLRRAPLKSDGTRR